MGIIIAQIIRRTQLIERGRPDPFPIPGWSYPTTMDTLPIMSDELSMNRFAKGLEEADNVNAKNNALLRLVLILENGSVSHTGHICTNLTKILYLYSIRLKASISIRN